MDIQRIMFCLIILLPAVVTQREDDAQNNSSRNIVCIRSFRYERQAECGGVRVCQCVLKARNI